MGASWRTPWKSQYMVAWGRLPWLVHSKVAVWPTSRGSWPFSWRMDTSWGLTAWSLGNVG